MNALGLAFLGMGMVMAPAQGTVVVRHGTDVLLAFQERVSSRSADVGEQVMLRVAKNVYADGKIVLPAGTPVVAVIDKVERNGRFGKNARIEFSLNPINVNGQMIQLEPRGKGLMFQGGRTAGAAAASGAGAVALGPVGLLAGWGVVGKPVVIKPGHTVETEVSETVAVNIR